MPKLRTTLLAASLLIAATSAGAWAQRGPVYDPAQLPAVKGKVAQYLLGPRGDVNGFLLADGTEVHVAPRLSDALVFTVKPGDAVTIHGLKAKAVPMIMAGSVTNDATGTTVEGWRSPHGTTPIEVEGQVKAQLHTPRGDVDGVLLENGAIVRLPPPEAQRLTALLEPGKTLFARGVGGTTPLGTVVSAQAIGADKEHTQPVAGPRPGPGPHDRPHGPMMGGPGGPGPMGPADAPPPPRP
ncbi:hypothetical protein [Rhodovastum atsumiense]|uniref:hypothetical protein n=1 Tax=Rhodovastum atsumiense TaxID=504468 RepID=UPI00139F291F|nr:hypothetical protein [Rhodovastum atsumiense]